MFVWAALLTVGSLSDDFYVIVASAFEKYNYLLFPMVCGDNSSIIALDWPRQYRHENVANGGIFQGITG